jgi:hypothetical protein
MRSPTLAIGLTLAAAAPAGAHDWYKGLLAPSGIQCCDDRDCRPVPYRLNAKTGREEVEANGRWWPVELDKVLALSTPDGGAHACWDNPRGKPRFRCLILPGMASLDPLPPGGVVAATKPPPPPTRAAGR